MKIAIVKLSALGDIVHAMVVLQFIRKFNKEILVDWVVDEAYSELIESNPDINQVFVTNLKKAKKSNSLLLLLSELNKLRKLDSYDIVIDMQGLIKSAIISKLIKSKKTIGFDKNSVREGFASLFYTDKFNFSYSKNIIERNIAIIEFALGMKISMNQIHSKEPFLYSSNNKLNFNLSSIKKNILLIPSASHISKCYPPEKLAQLTNLIDADFFVTWGNHKEKIIANRIKHLSKNVTVCNKLNFNSLVFLISKVDLVIGPDTGPTHIAWAMNIPSITLFGPTPGYRNSFVSKINQIIESNSIVDPNKIDKTENSIEEIKVQEILKISKELLKVTKNNLNS
jgi:heptosyltransferase I